MSGGGETIEVACIATPEGEAFFCEADKQVIAEFWTNWRNSMSEDRLKQLGNAGCMGGVVLIRMLRADYQAIPATCRSAKLFPPNTR